MGICTESCHIVIMDHCPWDMFSAMAISSMASPIRFVNTVSMPLDNAYLFW